MNIFKCCRAGYSDNYKTYHDRSTFAVLLDAFSMKTGSSEQRNIDAGIQKFGKAKNKAIVFKCHELVAATGDFDHEFLVGEGGFGSVYKGYIESIDQVVAVKQLDRNGMQGSREFFSEVLMLSLVQHQNLVNLIGYCVDDDQRILVYEYMSNGSLQNHFLDLAPGKKPLDWITRIEIAEGEARGLVYLHEVANPPVIYRDFKASNILLDEDFNPKLSDFGLAKLGPTEGKDHVSTRVMGTFGYCAPEYAMKGRSAIDYSRPNEEQNLITWAQPLIGDKKKFSLVADPLLEVHYPQKGLYQALQW